MGSSQNTIFLGILTPANDSLQNLISSSSETDLPLINSPNAQGVSPHLESGFATTADRETDGCFVNVFSISTDDMFSPPDILYPLIYL